MVSNKFSCSNFLRTFRSFEYGVDFLIGEILRVDLGVKSLNLKKKIYGAIQGFIPQELRLEISHE